jgi:hypothetical protein
MTRSRNNKNDDINSHTLLHIYPTYHRGRKYSIYIIKKKRNIELASCNVRIITYRAAPELIAGNLNIPDGEEGEGQNCLRTLILRYVILPNLINPSTYQDLYFGSSTGSVPHVGGWHRTSLRQRWGIWEADML